MSSTTAPRSLVNCPWVEAPFFELSLEARGLRGEEQRIAREFHEKGYVVLDGVLSSAECDQIRKEVEPIYDPSASDGARSRYRIQDAWRDCPAVAALAAKEKVIAVLRLLYDREPIPFQTLNFRHGSQQHTHSDAYHFTCLPSRFMCGVWVALEDVTAENGPLHYFVGSHQLPEFDYTDFRSAIGDSGLEARYNAYMALIEKTFARQEFFAKKGQALIWAANLWHGGSPIKRPGATRHSQVTHYYFEDGIYYFPMNSVRPLGQFELKNIIDIRNGRIVPHKLNGVELEAIPIGSKRSVLVPKGHREGALQNWK